MAEKASARCCVGFNQTWGDAESGKCGTSGSGFPGGGRRQTTQVGREKGGQSNRNGSPDGGYRGRRKTQGDTRGQGGKTCPAQKKGEGKGKL